MNRLVRRIICLIICSLTCSLFSHDLDDIRSFDIFDNLGDMEENMIIDADFLDSLNLDEMMAQAIRAIPIATIMTFLAEIQPQICTILSEPFYKKTNPFAYRSLLDLPIFEAIMCKHPYAWDFGAFLFWNHTDRMVFSCNNSTNINSYLALNEPTVIGAIKNILSNQLIAQLFKDILADVDFEGTIKLFENFTVQQRRIGFMFHLMRDWERFEFRAMLPLYYFERNIFARPEEQAAIERQFGVLNDQEQKQFQENHAINDLVGFGDTRIEALFVPFKTEHYTFWAGVQFTFPTAFAIFKGIKGTTFDKELCQPTFDLKPLLLEIPLEALADPDLLTPENKQDIKDLIIGDICRNQNGFLLDVIDRLNSILLNQPLGNRGHVGIGAVIRTTMYASAFLEEFDWASNLSYNSRISVEFFTPNTETRFFACRSMLSTCTSKVFADEDQAEENFDFIQEELVKKFFPYAICTKVQPGVIFRWLSRICYSGTVWDFTIGTDLWIQWQEKLKKLKASSELRECLDVCDAITPFAGQSKIYTGLGYKVKRDTYKLVFSLNAEATTWNKGIGSDWTVALNVEGNF